jgi:hypothetical protein
MPLGWNKGQTNRGWLVSGTVEITTKFLIKVVEIIRLCAELETMSLVF